VIEGFRDRIWPSKKRAKEEDSGGKRPWDTIKVALKLTAETLAKDLESDSKINVWFTGHSLGCALATLAYARSINSDDFANTPILIRDAYIFAAPVTMDRIGSDRFNQLISGSRYVQTLWRATNDSDAVATLLPQFGDNPNIKLSPTNPLAFAHLGAEIKMKSDPLVSNVAGSLWSHDTIVTVVSQYTKQQLNAARLQEETAGGVRFGRFVEVWLEKIPLLGRLIAHDTVLYWDQLNQVALGTLKWIHSY